MNENAERFNQTLIKNFIYWSIVFFVATFCFNVATQLYHYEYPDIEVEIVRKPKTIEEKISQYDWDSGLAYAIMMAESHASSTVVNYGDNHGKCVGSIGLFQVACFWSDPEKLKDPEHNIEVAYQIYSQNGWRPWGAYTNGSYQKYLR